MEFLIPVPDHRYYLWQMLVQVAHFREMGYEEDAHYLVGYFGQPSDTLRRLFESDALRCYIHAYPDQREDRSYSASLAPWLLGEFFAQFPDQATKTFNFLDPDCIFTHPMDFRRTSTTTGAGTARTPEVTRAPTTAGKKANHSSWRFVRSLASLPNRFSRMTRTRSARSPSSVALGQASGTTWPTNPRSPTAT